MVCTTPLTHHTFPTQWNRSLCQMTSVHFTSIDKHVHFALVLVWQIKCCHSSDVQHQLWSIVTNSCPIPYHFPHHFIRSHDRTLLIQLKYCIDFDRSCMIIFYNLYGESFCYLGKIFKFE